MSLVDQNHFYGAHGFMGDLLMEFDLEEEEVEVISSLINLNYQFPKLNLSGKIAEI